MPYHNCILAGNMKTPGSVSRKSLVGGCQVLLKLRQSHFNELVRLTGLDRNTLARVLGAMVSKRLASRKSLGVGRKTVYRANKKRIEKYLERVMLQCLKKSFPVSQPGAWRADLMFRVYRLKRIPRGQIIVNPTTGRPEVSVQG